MTINSVSKIGPKGQIVLKKKLRDRLGLKEGMLVEERLLSNGILIKLVETEKILEDMEIIAKKVSKKWPKDIDSVEAVRRERR